MNGNRATRVVAQPGFAALRATLGVPVLLVSVALSSACGASARSRAAAEDAGSDHAADAGSGASASSDAGTDGGMGPLGSAGAAGMASDAPVRGDDDPLPPCMRQLKVANSAALKAALPTVKPGDCVVLADGDYQFLSLIAQGKPDAPIVIQAEHLGKATVSTGMLIFEGAAYVAIEGLTWQSSGNVQVRNSDHCRITRSIFKPQEAPNIDWLVVSGTSRYTRIDHNEIGPKRVIGNLVFLDGDGTQVVQHTRIDHNYFHDVAYTTGNGWESIRAGLSQLALSSGFSIIEHNLFQRCGGDPETLSIKSSDNIVRYNTLLDSKGELTLRHGNRNYVYGNYILGNAQDGTGGIRVCGQDHRIFDNYIQGVTGPAISLEGGDSDAMNEAGTAHYRVYRAEVTYNTVVDSAGIEIGGSHPFSPVDCVVADNIVQASAGNLISELGAPSNTSYLGNIVHAQGVATVGLLGTSDQILAIDPKLVAAGAIFSLSPLSPAIDRGVGSFDYVREDVDGRVRSKPDVGAQEYSTEVAPYPPLTPADVGPDSP